MGLLHFPVSRFPAFIAQSSVDLTIRWVSEITAARITSTLPTKTNRSSPLRVYHAFEEDPGFGLDRRYDEVRSLEKQLHHEDFPAF